MSRLSSEPKTLAEMLSEALREIGMLYLVFGILDAQLLMREWVARGDPSVLRSPPVDNVWYAGVVVVSVILIGVGTLIERLR
jgi:hypothetical protein